MNNYAFIFRLIAGLLFIPYFAHCETRNEYDLFRQQCAALAQNAEKTGAMAVVGNDGWLFLSSELRHLGVGQFWGEAASRVSKATKPESADPLPAIIDFNDQLKKIGVELILVPVPPKAVIYPDMLPGFTKTAGPPAKMDNWPAAGSVSNLPGRAPWPALGHRRSGSANLSSVATERHNTTVRLDRFHQEFYTLLQSKGIKVLDLTDFFLQNKNHSQGPLYCRQDSHWSGNGCVLAAERIAAETCSSLGEGAQKTSAFKSDWLTIEINGDLWRSLNNKDIPREKICIRKISKPGTDEPIEPDAESRVILLGDSHNLVFHAGEDMLFSGAGLPEQLAFALGAPIDLVAVRGSGATPARINLLRRTQQKKDYWKNKKCVIWCFSAREFTESDGWQKIPILPLNTPPQGPIE